MYPVSAPAKHQVREVGLILENVSTQSVQITKSVRSSSPYYKPQITEEEKADARDRTDRLNQIFVQGFAGRFQRMASSKGLQVTKNSDGIPSLRVNVVHREMKCNLFDCEAQFRVRVDVFDPEGPQVWYYILTYGQDRPSDKLGNELFDRFTNKVLEQMRNDGLLVGGRQ